MKSPVAIFPLRKGDAAEFAAAARRSRRLHRPWVAPPREPDAVAALAANRSGPLNFGFAVRETGSLALVGYIEITNIVRGVFQSGYLGYYAFAGFERRGYMTAGLNAVVRHAFEKMRLHRLEANIRPENAASIALVRSVGFSKEGFSPKYLKLGGRWRDHERWAIVRGSDATRPRFGKSHSKMIDTSRECRDG